MIFTELWHQSTSTILCAEKDVESTLGNIIHLATTFISQFSLHVYMTMEGI